MHMELWQSIPFACILLPLGSVNSCRQFGVSEHIHHTVITNSVTASKVLVGVVVKHTPTKASCDIIMRCHRIQNIGMTNHVFSSVFFPIVWLCGIHMPIVLRNQIAFFHIGSNFFFRLTALITYAVNKIIICIYIL